MTPDQELMLLFGALHVAALVFGGVLFAMLLRSETVEPWRAPEEDDGADGGGGGGNDRRPQLPRSPRPDGGLPLPDADPAPVRLRDRRRLADAYPPRHRRREHAPEPRPQVPSQRLR